MVRTYLGHPSDAWKIALSPSGYRVDYCIDGGDYFRIEEVEVKNIDGPVSELIAVLTTFAETHTDATIENDTEQDYDMWSARVTLTGVRPCTTKEVKEIEHFVRETARFQAAEAVRAEEAERAQLAALKAKFEA